MNILANATQIFTETFGRLPDTTNHNDIMEIKNICTDLEYLYENIESRTGIGYTKAIMPETENIPVLPSLYWVEETHEYNYIQDADNFSINNTHVVHYFEDAERILKEIMHEEYCESVTYVEVSIYETAWENGELTPTHIVMQYVDTECEESGKGNLYRAEKTFIEENGEEKEIAVLISGTEDTVMEQIKAGATVSIHQKREDYVIYKIITDMSTSYYGVEIPRK